MRITQSTVEKISDYLKAVTGGTAGLLEVSRPGDGTIHYVDMTGWVTFTGRHASRRAAAYYGAAAAGFAQRRGREVPALLVAGFAERRGREVPAWLVALLAELDGPGAWPAVRDAAREGRAQAEHIRPGPSHVTAEHTYTMITDGSEFRYQWATVTHEKVTRRYGDVHDWTITLDVEHHAHPGDRFDITHADMIDAMRVMVAERAERTTHERIIDRIAAVLRASDGDAAGGALCQLDNVDVDLVAQVAAVGKVINP